MADGDEVVETHEMRQFREAQEATTELDDLDQANTARLQALMAQNVMPQAGLFEMQRAMVYFETLLEHLGLMGQAKLEYARRVKSILDGMEAQVTRAKLLQGPTNNGGPNRFQRRQPR